MAKKNVELHERKIVDIGYLRDDVAYFIISKDPDDKFFGRAKTTPVYMEDLGFEERVGLAWPFTPNKNSTYPKQGKQFPAITAYTEVVSTTQFIKELRKEDRKKAFIFLEPDEQLVFLSETTLKNRKIDPQKTVEHRLYFKDGILIEDLYLYQGIEKVDHEQTMLPEPNEEKKPKKKNVKENFLIKRFYEEETNPEKKKEEKKPEKKRVLNEEEAKKEYNFLLKDIFPNNEQNNEQGL